MRQWRNADGREPAGSLWDESAVCGSANFYAPVQEDLRQIEFIASRLAVAAVGDSPQFHKNRFF